jgi:hypothetical protein
MPRPGHSEKDEEKSPGPLAPTGLSSSTSIGDRDPDGGSRRITLVKVFSATTASGRSGLGDRIGTWLASNSRVAILKTFVSASSDRAFHCISIVLVCDVGEFLRDGPNDDEHDCETDSPTSV